MRLSLIFFMLILLPLATGVHAWLFCRDNLPLLTVQAVERLKESGVRDPVVDVRFFDVAISGEAPDPLARERAVAAIRELVPLRLLPEADRLHVTARVKATVAGKHLHLSGWLPEKAEAANVSGILAALRPDLTLHAEDLKISPEVRWPEGTKLPLTLGSPMLQGILDPLRVPAHLRITARGDVMTLSGLLPAGSLKEQLVAALAEVAGAREVDPSGLKASPHVLPAAFAKPEVLVELLREFFRHPPPRTLEIDSEGRPHLEGMATRQLESLWLALLRPVTGAARVDARLSLVPSLYHFPDYVVQSRLPPEIVETVRQSLQGVSLAFEAGTSRLSPEEQTKLALLAPVLLAAGPSLRLVIGGHPEPAGPEPVQRALAQARAESVLSFLVEQGVPATDITAVAFDRVPTTAPASSVLPGSVEIFIK
jgi:hypothetical protein